MRDKAKTQIAMHLDAQRLNLLKVVVAGGAADTGGGPEDLDSVEIYDVETDTWRRGEATLSDLSNVVPNLKYTFSK